MTHLEDSRARSKAISFVASAAEAARIEKAAADSGLSMASFARMAALIVAKRDTVAV